jgi:hypothetical protein
VRGRPTEPVRCTFQQSLRRHNAWNKNITTSLSCRSPPLTCDAGDDVVRSSGKAQGLPLHPGVTGKGKTGRVNASELPLMSRDPRLRRRNSQWGAWLAAEKR